MIKKIYEYLVDLLFPPRCPVCHEIVLPKGEKVCPKCRSRLYYVKEPYCMKCGKPLKNDEKEFCGDCERRAHFFTEGRAVFVYDETMRKSIYQFKYGGRQEYAGFYGEEIEKKLGGIIRRWNADVLIPIPLHKSRQKNRGYNQAELIAGELEKRVGIPVVQNLLVRVKKTAAQKNLNALERENNLKKAFKIKQNDVKLNSVILIDDIYTTGCTIDTAAKCLREAGIKKIYYIVLSIGHGL
ncbi:MAG TPA: ComF family protein [Lachnospiraceae bacterium]|nr:ComF family protein [Lachnospiraceae bacterium]